MRWVEITFDCVPLRSLGRLDVPLDASPAFVALAERMQAAIRKHGTHNAYYLHNATCAFHFSNAPEVGLVEFSFEGTVLTNETDTQTRQCDLVAKLSRETCEWLTQPAVEWLTNSVSHAVGVEFDRYIAAGDLAQTAQRMEKLQQQIDDTDGFIGAGV